MIPPSTPRDNYFSMILRDKYGKTKDAAMQIAGKALRSGLVMKPQDLIWNRSNVGAMSAVTLGFDVKESTSSHGEELRREIGEILINFPESFIHNIDRLSWVTVSRTDETGSTIHPGMMLTEKWLDFTQKDRIRISLMTPPGLIQIGTYQFSFPVTVPPQMPSYNIWTVSLCKANGGCITSSDSSVIITFPVPGFAIGEIHPDSGRRESSDAKMTLGSVRSRRFTANLAMEGLREASWLWEAGCC